MKITPELIDRQWDSINCKKGGFLQIDIRHPLEWFIGYHSVSRRSLLMVADTEIGVVESSESMAVSRRRRETDNRWVLTFELVRDEQQDVFAIFCCDIIEHSRCAVDEKVALKLVINRYKQWLQLLELQKCGLMDGRKRKGLLGELLFLEQRIKASSDSVLDAVLGWIGAEGGDQDFVYPEGWYEVKSLGVSASTVTISSMEQLDREDVGELVIIRLDRTVPDAADAISLNDVVYRISDRLKLHTEALNLFRSKLVSCGYLDLQEYSGQKYRYSAMQRYRVDASFPRITLHSVPEQTVSLHYELSLPALASWLKG